MCFNKNNKQSCILGYTLNGLYFAKSHYDLYDKLDFTKSGNIVSWIHKKEIQILYGESLKRMTINSKDKDFINNLKLNLATWVKFNYFLRKNEQDSNVKIITFTLNETNNTKMLLTIDVSRMKSFD